MQLDTINSIISSIKDSKVVKGNQATTLFKNSMALLYLLGVKEDALYKFISEEWNTMEKVIDIELNKNKTKLH